MRIDSHQHFWQYHPVKDAWITDEMKVIQRDFLPQHIKPLLEAADINGCVAVQADQSETETGFLLQLAEKHSFIKGVVGWVNLAADNLENKLQYFAQFKKLKGFRHIVQAEPQDDFLLREDFCRGIGLLAPYHFTYDILIYPRHLPVALQFVQRFPHQKFVVDHLAKPDFKQADFSGWEKGIRALAACPNVYCKLSGLVTEGHWQGWKYDDFSYCLHVVMEAFGPARLMFGSDWPVCLLAAGYAETCNIVQQYLQRCSAAGQAQVWGETAVAFYNL